MMAAKMAERKKDANKPGQRRLRMISNFFVFCSMVASELEHIFLVQILPIFFVE